MGKTSRNKGSAYEREIANLFRDLGWEDAKRHLEFQGPEAEEGRDIDNTQPFAVQCKCWNKTPSITALEQIQPTDEYPVPIAFLKRTQSKGTPGLEVVVMPVVVFANMLDLLKDAGFAPNGSASSFAKELLLDNGWVHKED